jgi:hypothetical protein
VIATWPIGYCSRFGLVVKPDTLCWFVPMDGPRTCAVSAFMKSP